MYTTIHRVDSTKSDTTCVSPFCDKPVDGEDDRENIDSTSPIIGKEMRNIATLGLTFLFLFSAYSSIQNLQGSLNDEDGLGVISLACLYASAILSSVFAPVIVSILTVKWTLILALLTQLVYTAANFIPSFVTLIPSTILIGLFWCPMWNAQAIYLTTVSFSYAERTGITVYTSLTKFNGIYYALYNLSSIVGNLVSSLVLFQGGVNATSNNSNITSSVCGVNDCPDVSGEDRIADPDAILVYTLLGVYLGCILVAIILASCLTPIPRECDLSKDVVKKLVRSWFSVLVYTDMKYLVPLMCYFAVAEELLVAEVTKSYFSCPIGIQYIGFVMTAYGASSSAISFLFSRISKYTRRYVVLTIAAVLQMCLLVRIYHWVPTDQDTVYIFLLGSLWGICEGMWKTQNSALIGEIFSSHTKTVFAVKEGLKCIAFSITFAYSSVVCVYVKLLVTMAILVLALIFYYFVEYRFIQRMKDERADKTEEKMCIDLKADGDPVICRQGPEDTKLF